MPTERAQAIAARVEAFVRDRIIPYEADPRRDHHGAPTDALVDEMRAHARAAGVLTPHIRGGPGCLNRLAVWISGSPLVDHAAARSGWSKYTWSGVLVPRAECGRMLL